MIDVRAWLREVRALFLFYVALPALLGAAIALRFYPARCSPAYVLLAAGALVLLHAGTVMANDFFDFRSGTDVLNRARTPYSGGSGLLPAGILRPGQVLAASLLCFGLSALLGLFIAATRSPPVLLVGAVGLALGAAYTAPPFRLSYRGLGEAARLCATPLIVLGAFLVQVPLAGPAEALAAAPALGACLAASAPLALLNTAALYIFQFPDYEADRRVGKRNLVVRLGPPRATYLFAALQAAAYLLLLAGLAAGALPLASGLLFLLLPASAYAALGLSRRPAAGPQLLPYLRASSLVYSAASLLLVLAFLL